MWKCHKCGKPVYFAERKQSLGYDWHPECLRCEECGKRLNPGQHAEHKGVPYCHVPCYGALFGPQLFGHGTRVESHKSFGQLKESHKIGNGPSVPRSLIETKLKSYNQFFDGRSGEVRSREVNGRLILEGSLRIYWGIQGVIHLKEDFDLRTVTIRKRNSYLQSNTDYDSDDTDDISFSSSNSNIDLNSSLNSLNLDNSTSDTGIESGGDTCDNIEVSPILPKSLTLPSKLDFKNLEWDELDELLQVERKVDDFNKLYQTMPAPLPSQNIESPCIDNHILEPAIVTIVRNCVNGIIHDSEKVEDNNWIEHSNHLNRSMSGPDCLEHVRSHSKSPEFDQISINSTNTEISTYTNQDDVVLRRPKTGSTAIKRRKGRLSRSKIKRRCSINGHFYNRETSFFTPPHGSQMSVWVSSLVNTQEVINLILEKYKVESDANHFALFIVHDNGEQRRLRDEEYPLLVRVLQGPHEEVVRMFLMDSQSTPEVSNEVAQFLNLSIPELRAILNQYYTQEDREIARIHEKFTETKKRIKLRMEELKVRL